MSLYQHQLFTIDLTKIVAVNQNEEEAAITIWTDDQRKIEVATDSSAAAWDLLNDLGNQWEKASGPLLRHGNHIFLTRAIYSIQVEEQEVCIYFRDHSVSFTCASQEEALDLLAKLTQRWQAALGQRPAA